MRHIPWLAFGFLAVAVFFVASRTSAWTGTGSKDFSYSGTSAPTGQKPQSKLWFNDGIWWGSLFNSSNTQFEIYRFNWATDTWSTTGTLIDSRLDSDADALWDGSHLYVMSAVPPGTTGDTNIYLMRYSYNPTTKTYTMDTGFPLAIVSKTVECVVMDEDALGHLWLTYTYDDASGGRNVYVSHTTTDDLTWVTPYVIPLTGANSMATSDISAIVSFNGNIGVMWSNQNTDSMYFGIHADGDPDNVWAANPALQAPHDAGDHINLKFLTADASGQVYAVTKTSRNDVNPPTSSQPSILLLRLDNSGNWTRRTVWRVSDNFTRPIVLLDMQNRQIRAFGAQEYPGQTSGAVFMKQIPLDDPGAQFPDGAGTPFIVYGAYTHINNPSSTKQNLNSSTGLLVVAGDDTAHLYFHNKIALGSGSATPANMPTSMPANASAPSPSASVSLYSDGFESGDFSARSLVNIGGDGLVVVQSTTVKSGSFAAQLSETANTGSLAYIRASLDQAQTALTVSLDIQVAREGPTKANVPILRLFDPNGTRLLSLYRQNLSENQVWINQGGTNSLTAGLLPLGTWSHFDVRVITAGTSASTIQVYQDGTLIYQTTTASLGTAGVLTAQVGNETGKQVFTLYTDNMQISQ